MRPGGCGSLDWRLYLRRRARTADLTLELAGGNLTGVPVCILGAAFKPGSDDVHDSRPWTWCRS